MSRGGIGTLFKFVIDFIYCFLFFVVLDVILFCKDINYIKNVESYLKYEIKEGNYKNFKDEKVTVIVENNGKYYILLKRNSLLKLECFKIIEYGGIVC